MSTGNDEFHLELAAAAACEVDRAKHARNSAIRAALAEGATLRQTATVLGVTHQTIANWARDGRDAT